MSYSITIPMIGTIHINKFHIRGFTRRCSKEIYIHYTRNGKSIGRTTRNPFGEPNHYGRKSKILGYSRNRSRSKVVHYNSVGKAVGYSQRILWLFWIHHGLISKRDVIYKLW